MSIPDKKAILNLCREQLLLRKKEYLRELENLDEAAAAETKSSAGDKYETAREMIAQSRKLIEHNLSETNANLEALTRMEIISQTPNIGFGSLVETTMGWYLLGVSLGEWEIKGISICTLSLASPLGITLKGKSVGVSIPWRGKVFKILQIYA